MVKSVFYRGTKNVGQEIRLDKRGTSCNATWRKQEWDARPQGCGGSSHAMASLVSAQVKGKMNC